MLLDPSRITDDMQTLEQQTGYLLITGATGFVGQYLLRDLTNAGFRLAVLVRPSKRLNTKQRIESIMQKWEMESGISMARPVVLEGCITEDQLGLSDEDSAWVASYVDTILHNAAIIKFDGERDGEPWTTNVDGTRNVLKLAKQSGIDNFQYVSTAYSCGIQSDVVYEDLLDRKQEFRNDYERSKFEAESLVRDSGINNVTVFRPSVIVGDSQTGFTSSYHGLFVYLRLLALLIPNLDRDENGVAMTKIRLPFTGFERRNLVPVDWVSSVITKLVSDKKAHGNTFHLTPENTITPRELIDYCYNYFKTTGVEYADADCESDFQQCDSAFGENIRENTSAYHAYDKSDPIFDRANLKRFAGDVGCPDLDESTVHRFIEFGEKDKWGKGKQKPPICEFWLHENVSDISAAVQASLQKQLVLAGADDYEISLNVIGKGGGQVTFVWNGSEVSVRKGVLHTTDVMFEFDSTDVLSQLNKHDQKWSVVVNSWLANIAPKKSITQVA